MDVRIATPFLLALAVACNKPPDPLASYRASCEGLQRAGQLRKGLTVDQCAERLKQSAAANDPAPQVDEILSRLSSLSAQAARTNDPAQNAAVTVEVDSLARLGKAAVKPALAKLQSSIDPDFRVAVARALSSACASDCAGGDYSCLAPALLEIGGSARSPAIRHEAMERLRACTKQTFGDDAQPWIKWWSERKPDNATQAAR